MVYKDNFFSDKNIEWFNNFEKKALDVVMYYTTLKDSKKIISVGKTILKVRKEKIKRFGKDGANKTKIGQLKVLVKTAGLFIKPCKIEEILDYDGVELSK